MCGWGERGLSRLAWAHRQALLLPIPEGSPSSATTHSASSLLSRGFGFKAESRKVVRVVIEVQGQGRSVSWAAGGLHPMAQPQWSQVPAGHTCLLFRACVPLHVCVRVCVPGGCRDTHRGVLALPPGPPHLPCGRAGLLPLLLATSLLLLLSLLWVQTQPVKPGLDPRGPLPCPPTPTMATLPGPLQAVPPGRAGLHPSLAWQRGSQPFGSHGNKTSGDFGVEAAAPALCRSPSRWRRFLNHRITTRALTKKCVSG